MNLFKMSTGRGSLLVHLLCIGLAYAFAILHVYMNSQGSKIEAAPLMLSVVFLCTLVFTHVIFAMDMKDFVSLKYKVEDRKKGKTIKYLTLGVLFIPYWSTLETHYKKDVIKYIDKHKAKCKKEWESYIKHPDKRVNKTQYI